MQWDKVVGITNVRFLGLMPIPISGTKNIAISVISAAVKCIKYWQNLVIKYLRHCYVMEEGYLTF